MARYNDAIDRFMEAAHADGSYIPQPGRRLRLEFFDPDEPAFVDRLIGTAVRSWGVEDLEVIVKPVARHIAYFFPQHYLDDESAQFIRSLTLGGCSLLRPLHRYGKLTALVLQDISPSVPVAAYAGVFSRCAGLRSVHLRRCHPETDNNIPSVMEVDAPASGIIELVVYNCSFQAIRLLALPALERLECSGSPVSLAFGIIPRLAHVVLSLGFFILEGDPWDDRYGDYTLDELLVAVNPAAVTVTDLVLRFTGTYRWVEPWLDGVTPFPVLRRLLVADVPSNWDVLWAYLLLEAAPSLEVFHMSVTPCAEDSQRDVDIMWRPSKYRHRRRVRADADAGVPGQARHEDVQGAEARRADEGRPHRGQGTRGRLGGGGAAGERLERRREGGRGEGDQESQILQAVRSSVLCMSLRVIPLCRRRFRFETSFPTVSSAHRMF
ncbi:hypothetical protein CFC21_017150 [Triticum aestivum]|uniref:At1g61320/AtMIF1 LRR domain-containing protein n=2 Tax=Triticum aestivum TaxID=4565 RepID=A0A9R1E132_WHEAT|nr:hypothetical protein CFC21_017150 [Triticum aestivum]